MNDRRNSESGMAILMVLGIVMATTLLAAHMMAFSETIAKESAVCVMTSKLRYKVESATDVAFWMHLTDRRLFSSRALGNSLDDREAVSDFEPWMLDGREHELEDDCYAYLNDAIKQFSVNNVQNVKNNFDPEDTEGIELANTFIDIFQDYTDSDDFLNIYGKEVDDYETDGFPTLPRNDKMEFRAEIFWLDTWQDVIQGDITIIPPKGLSISQNNSKPSFFSSSEEDIRRILELNALKITDAQIDQVIDARREWQETGTALSELIDGDLLITVKNLFSFTESNYAEITAVATAYNGSLQVVRTVTREVDMSSNSIFSDKQSETFSIWETRNH